MLIETTGCTQHDVLYNRDIQPTIPGIKLLNGLSRQHKPLITTSMRGFYCDITCQLLSQHSVANEKIVVLSLWREESIYRLCELTLA